MNKSLCADLLLYSCLLVGGVLVHHFSIGGSLVLWTGIMGGLSLGVLGILGISGFPVRRLAIGLTMILSLVLLAQAVAAWWSVKQDAEGEKVPALVLTVLCMFAAGQCVNLIQNRRNLLFDTDRERDAPKNGTGAPEDQNDIH